MNMKRNIILWIFIVIVYSSCCWQAEDSYYSFNENTQLLLYEIGDTLIYKNNFGSTDTFYVSGIYDGWSEHSNEDLCDTYTHDQFKKYYFTKYPFSDNEDREITVCWNSTWFDWNNTRGSNTSLIVNEYELNGKSYNNVSYEIDEIYEWSYIWGQDNLYLTYWYYFSTDYGLLQFSFNEIETWYLSEIIK